MKRTWKADLEAATHAELVVCGEHDVVYLRITKRQARTLMDEAESCGFVHRLRNTSSGVLVFVIDHS